MATNGNGNGWRNLTLALTMAFAGWAGTRLWDRATENTIRLDGDFRGVVRELSEVRERTSRLESSRDDISRRLDRIEAKLDALLSERR